MVLCGHTGPDARAMLGLGSLNDQQQVLGKQVCPLDSRVSRAPQRQARRVRVRVQESTHSRAWAGSFSRVLD
eukprot:180266-Rhodomonas_salina.1